MDLDSSTLLLSAQRWMAVGLQQYASGEDLDFAIHHVGVATEHLLKAYLASLHPALVVDGKDFASLLYATGHGDKASQPMSEIRSIMGIEAFGRCKQLLKADLPVDQRSFQPLLNARNGVSHIGYHDDRKAREHLKIAFRVAEPLLDGIANRLGGKWQNSVAEFWGDFDALRIALLAEHADEVRVRYEQKLATARRNLERLTVDPYVVARVAAQTHWDEESWPEVCPVCGYSGWLRGDFGVFAVDASDAESGAKAGENRAVFLFPSSFECKVCGLYLHPHEFSLAGMPDEVQTNWDPSEVVSPGA